MLEFSLFLLLVIILIVVLGIKNSIASRFDSLEGRLDSLLSELRKPGRTSVASTLSEKESPQVETAPPKTVDLPTAEPTREKEEFVIPEKIEVEKTSEIIIDSSVQLIPTFSKVIPPRIEEPEKPGF